MADAHFDAESGEWIARDGTRIAFLPAKPAESPPHELISPGEPDAETLDGHAHYAIGSDPDVVEAIIAYYESQGASVPKGYAAAAKAHAGRAAKAAKAAAGSTEPDE